MLRFCREELLADNYFHAVLEAVKSVADKMRHLRSKLNRRTTSANLQQEKTNALTMQINNGIVINYFAANIICEQHGHLRIARWTDSRAETSEFNESTIRRIADSI